MSDSTAVATYQCSQCSAMYRRLDHLRRHETNHERQRICVCKFCNSQYHRKDILRRHYKTCKLRGDNPIPGPQPRGRRKQACDRCATFKLACNLDQPCQSCESSNSTCSWDRVYAKDRPAQPEPESTQRVASAASSPSEDEASEVVVPMAWESENRPTAPEVESLSFALRNAPVPFLLNFVSPETTNFVDAFGYCAITPETDSRPLGRPGPAQHDWDYMARESHGQRDIVQEDIFQTRTHTNGMSGGTFLEQLNANSPEVSAQRQAQYISTGQSVFRDFQMGREPNFAAHSPFDSGSRGADFSGHTPMGSDTTQVSDPLKHRLKELVMELMDIYISLPKEHYARIPDVRMKYADAFFTVTNFHLHAQTFFHHFYPHCPLIHRPSFDPNTASLHLLLIVCLAGALYSSLADSICIANSLLDLAEEFIFRNLYHEQQNKGHLPNGQVGDSTAHLQAIQAAISISFLQNWEGNRTARHRIRVDRFAGIVSSARVLRLTTAQNQVFRELSPEAPAAFDWSAFVESESRLRAVYYIFIMDIGFCVFHNYAPRLTLIEMEADFPCGEETFTAPSSIECFKSACGEKPNRPCSLSHILKMSLWDPFGEKTELYYKGLNTFHFFVIINALHSIIWTTCTSFLSPISVDAIECTLSRWETFWESHRSSMSTKQFKRLGFFKNAREYWWLANLLVFAMSEDAYNRLGQGESAHDVSSFEDDSMKRIRSLMQRYSQHCSFTS